MIKVHGKPVRVNKASQEKKALDVGANLFIGNLDPDVDEKMLYDTFSAFGVIVATPKIMRDPDSGAARLVATGCSNVVECHLAESPALAHFQGGFKPTTEVKYEWLCQLLHQYRPQNHTRLCRDIKGFRVRQFRQLRVL